MRCSFVLAAHNEGSLLWRTLESCVQTSLGLQFEIVVADDASWDGSVDETKKRFPEIRVVRHDERKGASPTKDLGARHARGEVLVFLDSHTKPEEGALQRLVEDVEFLKGTSIVTPAIGRLDPERWRTIDKEHLGHGYTIDLETLDTRWLPLGELREQPQRNRKFYETPALIGCAFAIHRDLYEDLRGFDPHMLSWGAEDLDLGLKSWLMGHPVLHDPEAVVGHRFQSKFENFHVPVEQLVANQLRLARKNLTDSVWSEWVDRCRGRYPGKLDDHPEGLWARAWKLFAELRASVENERSYLFARRVHDEFWYASRFGLPWPRLQREDAPVAPLFPGSVPVGAASAPDPSPSPSDFSHHLDARDDTFTLDSSGQASGNVITAANADNQDGHDTYDGIPIVDPATYVTTVLEAPQHGSVVLSEHGEFTYTHYEGSTEHDSFTYQLTGPGGLTDQATVNVLWAGTTDHEPEFPGDYSVEIPEDTAIGSEIITVHATDPDNEPLTYSLIGGNAEGTFEIDGMTGVIRLHQAVDYETKNVYSLTVKAMDPDGLSATANVVIRITNVNEPPKFDALLWRFVYDGTGELVGKVTATDPENDPLTFSSTDAAPTFRVEEDGSVLREENAVLEFPHTYEITVSVTDGNHAAVESNVRIETPFIQTVTAIDDIYSFTAGDGSPIESTRSVLMNDITNALSPLHARLVPGESQGTLTLRDDGTFTYEPLPFATYTDIFTYEAWFDPQGGLADPPQSAATITINIYYADEDLLEALDDEYDVAIRDAAGVYRANVLGNDTLGGIPFVPGSSTTLVRVDGAGPRFGAVTIQDDGEFEYTPNSGYLGQDSFVYRLTDDGQEDEAVVLLSVGNTAPTILNQVFVITSGARGRIGRIAASDVNSDQQMTFTLNSTTPDVNSFALSSDGILSTAGTEPLRVDETTTFQLSVTVKDNGTPILSDSAVITVQVVKRSVEISLKSVNFQDNAFINPDPGEGASYPAVEFDIDSTDAANPTPIYYHAQDTMRATVTFMTSSDIQRSILVRPNWPLPTAVSDIQLMSIPEGTSTTTCQISCIAPNCVLYRDQFEISFEASFDDGLNWSPIGTSRNVLYASRNFGGSPSHGPFRTVLHIATKYADEATDTWAAFDGIWEYFRGGKVTNWDNAMLMYNHNDAAWDTVAELLTNKEATCVGWTYFFLAVLNIHGIDSQLGALRESIFAKATILERPDLQIENVSFDGPKEFSEAPDGYFYKLFDNCTDAPKGLPGQNKETPRKTFNMHAVVRLANGKIIDPSYGTEFESLLDWEAAALAGTSVERSVGEDTYQYIRKRAEGDEMTYFGIFQ